MSEKIQSLFYQVFYGMIQDEAHFSDQLSKLLKSSSSDVCLDDILVKIDDHKIPALHILGGKQWINALTKISNWTKMKVTWSTEDSLRKDVLDVIHHTKPASHTEPACVPSTMAQKMRPLQKEAPKAIILGGLDQKSNAFVGLDSQDHQSAHEMLFAASPYVQGHALDKYHIGQFLLKNLKPLNVKPTEGVPFDHTDGWTFQSGNDHVASADEMNFFFLGTGSPPYFCEHQSHIHEDPNIMSEGGDVLCQLAKQKAQQDQPTLLMKGVGTVNLPDGSLYPFDSLIDPTTPYAGTAEDNVLGKGVNEKLQVAMQQFFIPNLISRIHAKDLKDNKIKINITGHSRGAITGIYMGNCIHEFMEYLKNPEISIDELILQTGISKKILEKIRTNNITCEIHELLFDPVEGGMRVSGAESDTSLKININEKDFYPQCSKLASSVKEVEVHIAESERRLDFRPSLPHYNPLTTKMSVKVELGTHSTMTGNQGSANAESYEAIQNHEHVKKIALAAIDKVRLDATRFLFKEENNLPPLERNILRRIFSEKAYPYMKKYFIEQCKKKYHYDPEFKKYVDEHYPYHDDNKFKRHEIGIRCSEFLMKRHKVENADIYYLLQREIHSQYLRPRDEPSAILFSKWQNEMRSDTTILYRGNFKNYGLLRQSSNYSRELYFYQEDGESYEVKNLAEAFPETNAKKQSLLLSPIGGAETPHKMYQPFDVILSDLLNIYIEKEGVLRLNRAFSDVINLAVHHNQCLEKFKLQVKSEMVNALLRLIKHLQTIDLELLEKQEIIRTLMLSLTDYGYTDDDLSLIYRILKSHTDEHILDPLAKYNSILATLKARGYPLERVGVSGARSLIDMIQFAYIEQSVFENEEQEEVKNLVFFVNKVKPNILPMEEEDLALSYALDSWRDAGEEQKKTLLKLIIQNRSLVRFYKNNWQVMCSVPELGSLFVALSRHLRHVKGRNKDEVMEFFPEGIFHFLRGLNRERGQASPLYVAAVHNNVDVVDFLRNRQIDNIDAQVNTAGPNGECAMLDGVKHNAHQAVIKLLSLYDGQGRLSASTQYLTQSWTPAYQLIKHATYLSVSRRAKNAMTGQTALHYLAMSDLKKHPAAQEAFFAILYGHSSYGPSVVLLEEDKHHYIPFYCLVQGRQYDFIQRLVQTMNEKHQDLAKLHKLPAKYYFSTSSNYHANFIKALALLRFHAKNLHFNGAKSAWQQVRRTLPADLKTLVNEIYQKMIDTQGAKRSKEEIARSPRNSERRVTC